MDTKADHFGTDPSDASIVVDDVPIDRAGIEMFFECPGSIVLYGPEEGSIQPPAVQSIRLPGQYFDPETGMNHNGFRDYAGGLTRYVQSDPIGLRGGMNTYQYVNGNPFKWIDTRGLKIALPSAPNSTPEPLCIPASSGPTATGGCATSSSFWQNFVSTLAIGSLYGALPPPTGPEDVVVGAMGASGGPPPDPLAITDYTNAQTQITPSNSACTSLQCLVQNTPHPPTANNNQWPPPPKSKP